MASPSGSSLSWGVIGCAVIAEKVCKGIIEAGHQVVAVGSRSKDKADAWAKVHAPHATAYGSYDEVLNDERVQVVYIPLPTAFKKEWVLKVAAKGKHVLCDKPLAPNFEDAQAMVEACEKASVQFMDNTMFMHNERLEHLGKVLRDTAAFGRVKSVVSGFSLHLANDPAWAANIRMAADTEPLGCLGDLGWYNVRLTLWAFGYEEPEEVSCHFFECTSDGTPITVHALMRYSGGRLACFDNSFKCSLRQWAEVVGEKRALSCDDFVIPSVKDKASFVVREGGIGPLAEAFPIDTVQEEHLTTPIQHVRLPQRFGEVVASGALDSEWPRISLQTHKVLIALYESGKAGGKWVKPARP